MYFAKAKPTRPEIPLLSFDNLGPGSFNNPLENPQLLGHLWNAFPAGVSGSAPNLPVNNPLPGSHVFVCILLQLKPHNTLSIFCQWRLKVFLARVSLPVIFESDRKPCFPVYLLLTLASQIYSFLCRVTEISVFKLLHLIFASRDSSIPLPAAVQAVNQNCQQGLCSLLVCSKIYTARRNPLMLKSFSM